MAQQDEGLKVLFIVLALGAFLIAFLTYGCEQEDQPRGPPEATSIFSR